MPSWGQFKTQHILSPTEFADVKTWNNARWNDWLRTRLGGNYGTKSINSVLVSTSQEVLNTFANPSVRYRPRQNFYWSNDEFDIFVLTLNSKTRDYAVRRLPVMFFLALIENETDQNRPVHFHGQAEVRISSGQLPNSWNRFPLVE